MDSWFELVVQRLHLRYVPFSVFWVVVDEVWPLVWAVMVPLVGLVLDSVSVFGLPVQPA